MCCIEANNITSYDQRKAQSAAFVALHHTVAAVRIVTVTVPVLRPVGNGATVITGNRPARRSDLPGSPSLMRVHVDRHSVPTGLKFVFGCLNVRSLTN